MDTANTTSAVFKQYNDLAFYSSVAMIAVGTAVFIFAIASKVYGAGYGRHYKEGSSTTCNTVNDHNDGSCYKKFVKSLSTASILSNCGPNLNAKFAWFLQETCAVLAVFLVVLFHLIYFLPMPLTETFINIEPNFWVSISPFLLHYIHRSWIYPCFIKTKNPVSLGICSLAGSFCIWNGATQALGSLGKYGASADTSVSVCYYGLPIFILGMAVNIWSDYHLIALKRENKGYQIPRALPFRLVSSPNYFGEIVEWIGYCVFNFQWASVAFAVFTISNLGPRAIKNHLWYVEKFGDSYPTSRKILVPFIY